MIPLRFIEIGLYYYEPSPYTAFTESLRFWVVVFPFSFDSMHILISFLIYVICWLFRSVLFSLHMFVVFIVFLFTSICSLIIGFEWWESEPELITEIGILYPVFSFYFLPLIKKLIDLVHVVSSPGAESRMANDGRPSRRRSGSHLSTPQT